MPRLVAPAVILTMYVAPALTLRQSVHWLSRQALTVRGVALVALLVLSAVVFPVHDPFVCLYQSVGYRWAVAVRPVGRCRMVRLLAPVLLESRYIALHARMFNAREDTV